MKSLIDDALEVHCNVTGVPQSKVPVYRADMAYFAAAASVQVFAILIILFTFYGWWRIGRDATFSPIEIAKAFDAPLLKDAPSTQSRYRVALIESDRKIQYGVLNDDFDIVESHGHERAEKLVIADKARVHKPPAKWSGPRQYLKMLKEDVNERYGMTKRRSSITTNRSSANEHV